MYNDVVKFIEACDQKPTAAAIRLYKKLIQEEFVEFLDAYDDQDNVEQLDACVDMIWVILGYMYMKGFDASGAWEELVQNNMSKLDPVTGKATKRADGKILKPDTWQEPNFSKFVR